MNQRILSSICISILLASFVRAEDLCRLESPDGLNTVTVLLDKGQPFYRVERRGRAVIENSPLGLRCEQEDFSRQMKFHENGPQESCPESYRLIVGNRLRVDSTLNKRRVTLMNDKGAPLIIELAASNEGVAFRYLFADDTPRTVHEERTGFQIAPDAEAWLQPYHAAGQYTPAYEDFYFRVSQGEAPPVSRGKPRGWCLPGLFHLPDTQSWILITESGVDGGYCASHLDVVSERGLYQIALAYEDEVTGAKTFNPKAKPAPVVAAKSLWRVIVVSDRPADIFNSTLVTDLAPPCQLEDTSWIQAGRASWSWWSHPDDKDTNELYNSFTNLAAAFEWEYTLFDAGWWNTDLGAIAQYANKKGIKPLVWMHAIDFYDAEKRKRKLDDLVAKGIKGIKVDFWCSDRQETMSAIFDTLKDAAERRLVVSLHGCTIPRGWHRTWPNLLTAEAVLGTECYFYEPRYPQKVAELSTILPFTRNVMAPMDITPVALTIRKFPRETTAVFELAASIVANSGIIHYADSVEVFDRLPDEIKQVLRDAPAVWDETVCLAAEPGKHIVVARRAGRQWFIAGLNGTDKHISIECDMKRFACLQGYEIREGKDPLWDFAVKTADVACRQREFHPFGGFILHLKPVN